jgi:hypothetical protein
LYQEPFGFGSLARTKKPLALAYPLRAYTPTSFGKLATLTGYSSPLEGERANDCNGSCTSGAVRGQKLRASEVLMLREKLKQKKFQRWRFLDFVFNRQFFQIFN